MRRKLFGGRLLHRIAGLDVVAAAAWWVCVSLSAWFAEAGPLGVLLVIAGARTARLVAGVVLRDPLPWRHWWMPGVLAGAVIAMPPVAALAMLGSGAGLGVFLLLAGRGADPLARAGGIWLLAGGVGFLQMAANPPATAWPAMVAGAVAAIALCLGFALQRTIGSKGS